MVHFFIVAITRLLLLITRLFAHWNMKINSQTRSYMHTAETPPREMSAIFFSTVCVISAIFFPSEARKLNYFCYFKTRGNLIVFRPPLFWADASNGNVACSTTSQTNQQRKNKQLSRNRFRLFPRNANNASTGKIRRPVMISKNA